MSPSLFITRCTMSLLLLLFALTTAAAGGGGGGDDDVAFRVWCRTTKGPVTLEIRPDWAKIGARRFRELVEDEFFTDMALYRGVDDFLVQFGISGDRDRQRRWDKQAALEDDAGRNIPFREGTVSFAGSGPRSRKTQIFIQNGYSASTRMLGRSGRPWETPIGVVVEGLENVRAWFTGYGDKGGPSQRRLRSEGNVYIREQFPETDFIHECRVIGDGCGFGQASIGLCDADEKRFLAKWAAKGAHAVAAEITRRGAAVTASRDAFESLTESLQKKFAKVKDADAEFQAQESQDAMAELHTRAEMAAVDAEAEQARHTEAIRLLRSIQLSGGGEL